MNYLKDFNPRAPRGARPTGISQVLPSLYYFNPRAPRGARPWPCALQRHPCNFNPRAPRGARRYCQLQPVITSWIFQSTRPARGATAVFLLQAKPKRFQSTRPARGATLSLRVSVLHLIISIHAPREGRDGGSIRCHQSQTYFNPRAPRGARLRCCRCRSRSHNFNPRAPRGARQLLLVGLNSMPEISIHAPREGRDRGHKACLGVLDDFNPRAPRGARRADSLSTSLRRYFNPRAPRGARPLTLHPAASISVFQSTRPARGAT